MPNYEIIGQWARTLESGDYEQGKGKLSTSSGKFCCLGVLCDMAAKDGVVDVSTYALWPGVRVYGGCINMPPDVVMEWAGLTPPGPGAERDEEVSYDEYNAAHHPELLTDAQKAAYLADLNDSGDLDFRGIAAVIRRIWPKPLKADIPTVETRKGVLVNA